jgi:hypothetical protein
MQLCCLRVLSRKSLRGGGFDVYFVSEFVKPAEEAIGQTLFGWWGKVVRAEVAVFVVGVG